VEMYSMVKTYTDVLDCIESTAEYSLELGISCCGNLLFRMNAPEQSESYIVLVGWKVPSTMRDTRISCNKVPASTTEHPLWIG